MMKLTDASMPVDGTDERPIETRELAAGPTIGAWFAGSGPRAVFACQLLPADGADAEVEIRMVTRDPAPAKARPRPCCPVPAGQWVHSRMLAPIWRENVRLLPDVTRSLVSVPAPAGPATPTSVTDVTP